MMKTRSRLCIFFSSTGAVAFKLPCHDGVTSVEHQPEICSSHEETDVRIIIYIKYIQTTMSHIKTIRVTAKDSDIFFILLYSAKSFTVDILMDTGETLINISQLVDNNSQENIAAMLSFLYPYLLQLVSCGRLMMITLSMASMNLRVACMGLDRE